MEEEDCCDHLFEILGQNALVGASLARASNTNDGMVDFLVTSTKQPNYLEYCGGLVLPADPVATINQYTDHNNSSYAKVNLALASDSHLLRDHGQFIKELRASVLSQPLLDYDLLYRGVDLSAREVQEMEAQHTFFIPSFTSTSVDSKRAYAKSALLVIKTPIGCKYACSITEELSKFYNEEREVLLACYSAYTLERVENVGGTKVITLYLDEFLSSLTRLHF
jgi:hypothetical protein